jgi:predicted porin
MKAFRQGYKLYAWRASGKRTIYDSATLSAGGTSLEDAEREYDRDLMGIGGTYFDGKYRFWAEYIKVDGMIFNGSTGGEVPGSVNGTAFGPIAPGILVSQFKTEPEGKGDGGYLDFGYRIKPNIELDIRYDWYNRVTNLDSTAEIKFETWTLGAQYFFTKTTKAIVNYEWRNVDAVGLPSSNIANEIAGATDNRISAQLFLLF